MKVLRRAPRALIFGLVAVTAVVGTLTLAGAAIPGADKVIKACYSSKGEHVGELRVIDPSVRGACGRGETALEWNQQGLKGDPGVAGPQGAAGATGAAGAGRLPRNWLMHGSGRSAGPFVADAVPAGTYVVNATAVDILTFNAAGYAYYGSWCSLLAGTEVIGSASVIGSDFSADLHVSMNGIANLSAEERLSVNCSAGKEIKK